MASRFGESARVSAIRTFPSADIRGYTRFTAGHGDEAASRLATRFAAVAHEGDEARAASRSSCLATVLAAHRCSLRPR
jgi:class 3 adenylate cyclase